MQDAFKMEATPLVAEPRSLRPSEVVSNALSLLIEPGTVFELRALGCIGGGFRRPHGRGGFFHFDSIEQAGSEAIKLSGAWKAHGVYFTLNPLNPELLARRCNRTDVTKEGEGACDADVLHRRWMLIDCDPVRTRGISSNRDERQAAYETAIEIRTYFSSRGWPDPILCDSGNGCHLLYRVDLANDDAATKLIKRCLRAVAGRFNNDRVSIDTSVFNAARICKLYGTVSRKGDSTEERPHRVSRIVRGPGEGFGVVDRLQLEALATEAPDDKPASLTKKTRVSGQSVGDRAAKYLESMPESVAGQHGHDKAYRAACTLVRGFNLTPEAAFPILWEWNTRCQPPWSERELQHKLEDAAVNADGEPGYLLHAPRPDNDGRPKYDANEFAPLGGQDQRSGGETAEPTPVGKPNPLAGFDLFPDAPAPSDPPAPEVPPATEVPPAPEVLPTEVIPFDVPTPEEFVTQEIPVPVWFRKADIQLSSPTVAEADDDPHRLARIFLARYVATDVRTKRKTIGLRLWREVFHAWDGRKYVELSDMQIKADITEAVKAEFDSITEMRSKEASRDPTKPVPVAKKVGVEIVNAVFNAVKSITILSDHIDQPAWLDDRYPVSRDRDFIAVENGILDVAMLLDDENEPGRCLLPHSPFWFSASCVPYPFNPSAECTHWEGFLNTNLLGRDEQIRILQEWFGYCLTNDVSQQKFLMMEGRGRNGKSVICAALTALLGQENVSTVPLEAFEKDTNITQTIGKLANIAAEIGEVDRVAEGVLKAFTSGDRMMFRRLYKNPFEGYPTARLVFATNNRPRFSDRSDGLWRRMILLPLVYQVPDSERIFGMDRPSYWRKELPGMLNWALAGLWQLRRNGRFTACEDSEAEMEEYRSDVNPARQFLLERYEWGGDGQWIVTDDAYAAYKAWCKEGEYRPVNARNFGKEIMSVWPRAKRKKMGSRDGRFWAYEGVAKKAEIENEFI